MDKKEKGYYARNLQKMMESPSIQKMRDYFEAKAGDLEYFSEKNFINFVKSIMQLVIYMGQPDPDSALQNLDEDVLNGYVKWLREKGNASGTQRTKISQIRRWVKSNCVKLEWDNVIVPKARAVVDDRAPTKTELRRIMSYATTWMIPTILILASSGLRVGSLILLRIKHLNLDSFPDIGVLEIFPKAAKGGIGYYSCITFEARDALEKHLKQRTQNGEILGPESPLIKSPMNKGNTTYTAVSTAWRRCLQRAGLDEKSRGFNILHLHTLRKFFRSQVEGVLTKSIREAMMGHVSGEYLDRNYLRIPEQKMVEWYRKAVPVLTILEDMQGEDYERKQLLRQAALLLPAHKVEMLRSIMENESNLDKAVEKFQRIISKSNNGNHEIIQGEDELLRLLDEGYELVEKLSDDKYLIKQN